MATAADTRGYRFFEWLNSHVRAVSVVVVVAAVILGAVAPGVADETEPEFGPGGEIYDTEDLVEQRFSSDSPIRGAAFLVEDREDPEGGDVLTAGALFEIKQNADAVRRADASDPDGPHLVSTFDPDLNTAIDGLFSIADAVDGALPGGLSASTSDAEVKFALDRLLTDDAPTAGLRFRLSRLTARAPGTIDGGDLVVWEAPAFLMDLRYDIDTFAGAEIESFDESGKLEAERWLRDVQSDLRGDEDQISVIGIAIDALLVDEEQATQAGPFIFLAVALIVLLVGALLRSYWAAMLAAVGLGSVMMAYNGLNSLIGLKVTSPLIIFVVPIALISFGIDFFIHGSGRVREAQVEGYSRERAYPVGMTALFVALLLAVASSIAAFLSNMASGIEAIAEFGIAAAIAIGLSYLVLGLLAPRQLLAIEAALGPRPADHGLHVLRRLGFLAASLFAGVTVTLTIVQPLVGAPVFVVFLLLLVGIPYRMTKRRNARAAAAGKPMTEAVKGAGHGFQAAGTVVHFLARWRVVTLPVVLALAVVGTWAAFRVESGFKISDFYSTRTDFIQSLDKLETHFGSSAAGTAYIYVEGDLTSAATLAALDETIADLDSSPAEFVRDFNGDLEVTPHAAEIVRIVTASAEAANEVTATTGVDITDGNGDGYADTPAQISAIYDHVARNGVPGGGGVVAYRPDQVQGLLYVGDGVQGTRLEMLLPSVTDAPAVVAARDVLEDAAADLASATDAVVVSVSGSAITTQDLLESFTSAMIVSLPLAILLTAILVLIALRSLRFALISMVPIILVVAWLFGFMWWVDYERNVITATIAAIAIGVGIDFATHFTVRFREEFAGEPSRFPALRRAGEGTGGALALSALTSITGFLVMAVSPMPMFATFGVLTAMMIFLALAVSLLVLPSLLLLVTPSRKGEEREAMELAITRGEYPYEPHARETAFRDPTTED